MYIFTLLNLISKCIPILTEWAPYSNDRTHTQKILKNKIYKLIRNILNILIEVVHISLSISQTTIHFYINFFIKAVILNSLEIISLNKISMYWFMVNLWISFFLFLFLFLFLILYVQPLSHSYVPATLFSLIIFSYIPWHRSQKDESQPDRLSYYTKWI